MGPEEKEPLKERIFEGLGSLGELVAGGVELFLELFCLILSFGDG